MTVNGGEVEGERSHSLPEEPSQLGCGMRCACYMPTSLSCEIRGETEVKEIEMKEKTKVEMILFKA